MQKVTVDLKVQGEHYVETIDVVGGTDEEIDAQVLDWLWDHVMQGWERVPEKEEDVWA